MQFPVKAFFESTWEIADEYIIMNGDPVGSTETLETLRDISKDMVLKFKMDKDLRIFTNPWEDRLGKVFYHLQKSNAISHASKDYVLLLDADEILYEQDHHLIRKAMDEGHAAYFFNIYHFYRDMKHIKRGPNKDDPGQVWYQKKVCLFKNGLGIHASHDHHGNYTDNLVTFQYEPVDKFAFNTNIRVAHVGHARDIDSYLYKKNKIERAFHFNHEDIRHFDWDMSGTIDFDDEYPICLQENIS